ncbi:MAG: TraB family protein [Thermoplasmata archaeon HGW-Thermoplasmata-1]|nr:MAG: TraB family protein [Thermoplasmata archaeon HGW-Thermoplasmata-1]
MSTLERQIGGNIVLIGTAHVSKKSVEEVRDAIGRHRPDVVAIELCKSRYNAIKEKSSWEELPISSMLKGDRAYMILAQSFMGSVQRRLGSEQGVEPGAEMMAALSVAESENIEVILVDRDITVTLKRAWRLMGRREKFRLSWEFTKALFGGEAPEEVAVDDMLEEDVLTAMMKEISDIAPSISNVLIGERDAYIASKIADAAGSGKKVLAVLGAGHLKGVESYLGGKKAPELSELEAVPKKRFSVGKAIAYAIPLLLLGLVAYLAVVRGPEAWAEIADIFLIWVLVNGTLSALGAAIARGHPLSILTAFVAAPITSLNPALAAGWFAGIVEAKIRMPTIRDFNGISKVVTLKDFTRNGVLRILVVMALANLGSVIGTAVALPWILKHVLG